MEKRTRYVLKHIPTGQYYSVMKDHTRNLWSAMRFLDVEQFQVWFETSPHIPKHPDDYVLIPVTQTIEEEKCDV